MIEILVALLVLSIGLAGMAALHLNSLKNVSSSYYRSLASTIALDFEERLWLEASRATDADLDAGCPVLADVAAEVVTDWTSTSSLNDWATGERATLPGLNLSVPEDINPEPIDLDDGKPTTWIEVPVTVSWTEDRFEGDDPEAFVYTVRTLCRQPPATSG